MRNSAMEITIYLDSYKQQRWDGISMNEDKIKDIKEDSDNKADKTEIPESLYMIESKSKLRLSTLFYFGIIIVFLQYILTRYAYKNNDSFGIMLALYTMIDITLFPAIIALGIVFITLFKRDFKRNPNINESLSVWIVISVIIGIIPVISFGDIFFFIFIGGINVLSAVIGGLILRYYVHNMSKLKYN